MWRHLTRNLKQGLKRSLCIEKTNSDIKDTTSQAHHRSCCILELLPGSFQNLNRCISKAEYAQDQKDYQKNDKYVGHHTLFEAFGWSGALVFGWVISKQLWVQRTHIPGKDEGSSDSIFNHQSLIQLLAHVVKTQPPTAYILPEIQSVAKDESTQSNCSITKGEPSQSDLDIEFESAAQELLKVHERAMAEALNRQGIASLSKSTGGTEAVTCFQRASQLKYPPASFNMGQCCELGIGMKQDFKQAAEWYKIASDQGHVTAMYNLGVFYAHGWGGLQADIGMAKQLFVKAAKLGQPDAKAALAKESKFIADAISNSNCAKFPFVETNESKLANIKSFDLKYFINSIRNGLNDTLLNGFEAEKHWNVPINKEVPS